ncbi:hypothetical protein CERSUDRAFT_88347 [Gelatoporia subvermispora B]|uniref:Uncharacterized protein n=1 Tax=Ceriporiopsis subvermispora (strain B) TaxID=914234 RepID=M2P9E4_CERS8|nr:hypothetical protein CERSUDRAFT_88347 [Gelatoporia subvermispora B]
MLFNKSFAVSAVVAAGVSYATAQSISSQCQATLVSLMTSPDAQCFSPETLAGLVVSSSNTSVVEPINNWLGNVCSLAPCSNSTLSTLVMNITSGCQSDLASLGITSDSVDEIVQVVQQVYPAVRQVACLADSSNSNTLCVTETLVNVQQSTGNLTVDNIESLVTQVMSGSVPNIPESAICQDCTQAAYSILSQALPSIFSQTTSFVSSVCGQSFTSGSKPSEIVETANNGTAANAAMALGAPGPVFGVTLSSLAAVSVAFAVLA